MQQLQAFWTSSEMERSEELDNCLLALKRKRIMTLLIDFQRDWTDFLKEGLKNLGYSVDALSDPSV
jgi:hypothetical protein